MKLIKISVIVTSLLLTITHASATSFEVQYDVRVLGIRIGSAAVKGDVSASQYSLTGNGRISGLANMVTSGYGEASSAGVISNSTTIPNRYSIFNTAGKKTNDIKMQLKNGAVTSLSVEPATIQNPDRLPLLESHKANIIDPLSTFVIPRTATDALSLNECNRTHKIFDGRQRYDIHLYPKEIKKLKGTSSGFSGEVLVCEAQYTPIGGHRSSKKVTQYLSENRENELWFAPTADFKALVPIRIQMSTIVGNLVIDAKKYTSQ